MNRDLQNDLPKNSKNEENKSDRLEIDSDKTKKIIKKQQTKEKKEIVEEEIRPHERRLKEKKPARNKKIENVI